MKTLTVKEAIAQIRKQELWVWRQENWKPSNGNYSAKADDNYVESKTIYCGDDGRGHVFPCNGDCNFGYDYDRNAFAMFP